MASVYQAAIVVCGMEFLITIANNYSTTGTDKCYRARTAYSRDIVSAASRQRTESKRLGN